VPSCSDAGTDFLLAGCSNGTTTAVAAEGTTSGTTADADTDDDAGAVTLLELLRRVA
jgi:hypothetical protein